MVSPQVHGVSQDVRRALIELQRQLDELRALIEDHEERLVVLEP